MFVSRVRLWASLSEAVQGTKRMMPSEHKSEKERQKRQELNIIQHVILCWLLV